jgi:hypothetical protein
VLNAQELSQYDVDYIGPWFDYDLQVWVSEGIVLKCGHPASMSSPASPCCNASVHAYAGSSIDDARRDFCDFEPTDEDLEAAAEFGKRAAQFLASELSAEDAADVQAQLAHIESREDCREPEPIKGESFEAYLDRLYSAKTVR